MQANLYPRHEEHIVLPKWNEWNTNNGNGGDGSNNPDKSTGGDGGDGIFCIRFQKRISLVDRHSINRPQTL